MVKVNVDIQSRGIASAYIVAPFDQGKEALEKAGYKIISLEKNAGLRVQEGVNHGVSQYGNLVRENVIYVPNKGIFLTKNSPIMANVKETIRANRELKDFYLTSEQVEQALVDSIILDFERLPKLNDEFPCISTNRFKDDPITVYAFGENAEKYGAFLREAGIKEMPLSPLGLDLEEIADLQDKPFARPVFFGSLRLMSLLDSLWFWDLGCGVRGLKDSTEGTTKNFEADTSVQIPGVLKAKGFIWN